jgi:GTP cyclohydrolase III
MTAPLKTLIPITWSTSGEGGVAVVDAHRAAEIAAMAEGLAQDKRRRARQLDAGQEVKTEHAPAFAPFGIPSVRRSEP